MHKRRTILTSNAQRFSWLVCELRTLLVAFLEHSEDEVDNPISHYALLNLFMSLEVLEKYSAREPNAVSLMESLYEKHKKMVDEQLKH